MRVPFRLGGVLLAAITLTLSACSGGAASGGGAAGGGAQTVSVAAAEYTFTPATATVKAGQPVTLTLRNNGTQVHDLTIDAIGGQKVQIIAQPGQPATGTFTPAAGTYQFYCSQPGHQQLGMQGTLTVNAS
ncbi:MAG: hypothetical protein QOF51_4033 [Chloroflexota bacterium]|jgi:plastocyanin|nr:hypothetical protein [Chloroflexota bacterium]